MDEVCSPTQEGRLDAYQVGAESDSDSATAYWDTGEVARPRRFKPRSHPERPIEPIHVSSTTSIPWMASLKMADEPECIQTEAQAPRPVITEGVIEDSMTTADVHHLCAESRGETQTTSTDGISPSYSSATDGMSPSYSSTTDGMSPSYSNATDGVSPSRSSDSFKSGEAPPFLKKKRLLIAGILLVLIAVAVIVGALFGSGSVGGDAAQVSSVPPPGSSAVPTLAPTPQPSLRPTAATSPTVAPTPPTNASVSNIFFSQQLQGANKNEQFGRFVVISRDSSTIAVGGKNEVKVFRLNGTLWNQIGQTLEGDADGDNFGRSVDLNRDGSVLAVGASKNDDVADKAGLAKVFRYDGTSSWTQVGENLRGYFVEDRFGWYVTLSDDGSTVAVSAYRGDPSPDLIDAGYVRVFKNEGSLRQGSDDWVQLGSDLMGEEPEDRFGVAMDMAADGRVLAVGASTDLRGEVGLVQVFNFTDGTWKQVGETIEGGDQQDFFGSAVALSADGRTLACGAKGFDGKRGSVRVYTLVDSLWNPRGEDILGENLGDWFGENHISLSDDGNCLAVGSDQNTHKTGKAYLYQWTNDSQWNQIVAVAGVENGDRVGESSTVSGDCSWVAFGASQRNNLVEPPGYVLVYRYDI